MSKNVTRLFEQFKPEHYTLELEPNKTDMTFSGTVIIRGRKTGRPSQRLTLHQKELKITSATITKIHKGQETEIAIDRINTHKSFDELRLHSKEMIYPGEYIVRVEFNGQITKPMNGMYPCFFKEGKIEKILIATQFESHHAREVFPCIDEPEAKATFDLALIAPKDEVVLANTPIKKTATKGQSQVVLFETTPKMSTYLLAFVMGDMKHIQAKTKNGTIVRAFTTPDKIKQAEFALKVTVDCLEFYNNYFAIPYPLAKCDIIALPDFAAGAMENWGCITFREQCMLVDEGNTSLAMKQYVAMVVAHELAHQWFGNLVTMRWWTDLWLNEGFASWIEYLAVDDMFPQWNMWTQYIADEQQSGMKLDALEHTHPIEVPVRHPDEIRTIFDIISYNKGSSVIHMLNQYLGADIFRDGLRYYLKKHAYGNTDTVDLWEALESVSHKPVKEFMHAWTAEPGYPIVHATVEEDSVELSQERFLLNRDNTKLKNKQLWQIPILSDKEAPKLLDKQKLKFTVPDSSALKLNSQQAGFYRTVYNATHLHGLSELVSRGRLEPLDRLGILSDVFEGAKAGYTDTDDALELLKHYSQEDNVAVWDIISGNIADVRSTMDDEKLREAMKPYVQNLVAIQLERLGWDQRKTDTYFDRLLRPTILGMASAADEPAVVKEAQKRFKEMKKPSDIDPDIRGVVYSTVARNGSENEFNILLALHNKSTSSEEQQVLTGALANFKQKKLINKYLSLIISDDVRLQDIGHWIAYICMNRHAKAESWAWIQENWEWLEKNLGSDLSFSRLPVYAARGRSDELFLKEYKAFFDSKMSPSLERSVKQGIEIVQWRSAWKKRDHKEILAFFTTRN